ncbi:hypothetical protein J437_LFUL012828 [Ladona fulva]|uniref:ZAD domain-containing protein n=1 Tax=Ladona fulva TaxID=123851 RepID=A0A8K0P7V9_LADFU|nr:hypothetical protein J437_LFUL012828 [Ladona fulva]
MNEINFDTLCRLCLRNSFFYMHIYVGQSVDKSPIYEVLNFVYDLEVSVDDGLPEYVCRDCLLKLKEFETYKRKAHRAKSELLSLKGNVEGSCVKEEIEEDEIRDEQQINETEIKVMATKIRT